MGKGRTAHPHQGRQVDDTFFIVAKKPKEFQPFGIRHTVKDFRYSGKVAVLGHIFKNIAWVLPMLMRQLDDVHT